MPKNKVIDDFTDEDKVESSIDFWKYKETNEVVGFFQRWETDSYGKHAVLQTEQGEVHLPNLTALNGKLNIQDVQEGQKVKAVYIGEKKAEKSGRMYEDFDVFIK